MATTAKVQTTKAERTREAVLAAAEDLFSERGFDATPLSAIGERAGIQGSAILYHHSSKRELYEAVLDRMFAPLFDEVGRQLERDGSLPDRLGAITSTMVRFAAARPAAARLVLRESVARGEAVDIVGTASQRRWAQFVDALAAEHEADFDPLVVWNIVVGAICFYFAAGSTVGGLTHDPCDPHRVEQFESRMIHVTHTLCGFDRHRPDPSRSRRPAAPQRTCR
jgi:TetR/AcrR family transcriptional regulator